MYFCIYRLFPYLSAPAAGRLQAAVTGICLFGSDPERAHAQSDPPSHITTHPGQPPRGGGLASMSFDMARTVDLPKPRGGLASLGRWEGTDWLFHFQKTPLRKPPLPALRDWLPGAVAYEELP